MSIRSMKLLITLLYQIKSMKIVSVVNIYYP